MFNSVERAQCMSLLVSCEVTFLRSPLTLLLRQCTASLKPSHFLILSLASAVHTPATKKV